MLTQKYQRLTSDPFSTYCSSNECFGITIDSSTFTNFGNLKALQTNPTWIDDTLKMEYVGQILDLESFGGSVIVRGSNFNGIKVQLQNCDAAASMQNNFTTLGGTNPYPIYGDSKTKLQIKSVISLVKHGYDFELLGNIFEYNSGTKGIIYLEILHRSIYHTLIAHNVFRGNTGYLDASVIFLRARALQSINIDIEVPTSGNTFCTGYHF